MDITMKGNTKMIRSVVLGSIFIKLDIGMKGNLKIV
jgi:hypothetical protein